MILELLLLTQMHVVKKHVVEGYAIGPAAVEISQNPKTKISSLKINFICAKDEELIMYFKNGGILVRETGPWMIEGLNLECAKKGEGINILPHEPLKLEAPHCDECKIEYTPTAKGGK